jgi:hypothetical protein
MIGERDLHFAAQMRQSIRGWSIEAEGRPKRVVYIPQTSFGFKNNTRLTRYD